MTYRAMTVYTRSAAISAKVSFGLTTANAVSHDAKVSNYPRAILLDPLNLPADFIRHPPCADINTIVRMCAFIALCNEDPQFRETAGRVLETGFLLSFLVCFFQLFARNAEVLGVA
jgi:hypothetical protein